MNKQLILSIVREAPSGLDPAEVRHQIKQHALTLEESAFLHDCVAAKFRLLRAEEEPERAAEHRAIAELICSQVGIQLSDLERQPTLLALKEDGSIDFPATYAAYRTAGKPRKSLLFQAREKMRAVAPELNDDQLETQIRLMANAVFAEVNERPFYRTKEAF